MYNIKVILCQLTQHLKSINFKKYICTLNHREVEEWRFLFVLSLWPCCYTLCQSGQKKSNTNSNTGWLLPLYLHLSAIWLAPLSWGFRPTAQSYTLTEPLATLLSSLWDFILPGQSKLSKLTALQPNFFTASQSTLGSSG